VKNALVISISLIGISIGILFVIMAPFPFVEYLDTSFTPSFKEDQVYFLVLGVDDAGEAGSDRTDVIAAICLDFRLSQIRIITVPRDLIFNISDNGSTEAVKINSIKKKFGLEKLKEIVEEILDIKFSRHAVVDYNIFKTLTDSIGKVSIYVENKMFYEDKQQDLYIDFEPGIHELNGEELLKYIRFRDDAKGDLGRIQRQKQAIQSLMNKIRSSIDLDFIQKSIPGIMKSMDTDIVTNDLIQIISEFSDLGNIMFVTYPYDILPSGNLSTNNKLLTSRVEEFKNGREETQISIPDVVFINGTKENAYVFSIQVYNTFNGSKLNWTTLAKPIDDKDLRKWFDDNSTVIMINKDKSAEEYVLSVLESKLKGKEFNVVYPQPGKGLEEYYKLVDYLTDNNQFYPFPSDAIIYVKSTN